MRKLDDLVIGWEVVSRLEFMRRLLFIVTDKETALFLWQSGDWRGFWLICKIRGDIVYDLVTWFLGSLWFTDGLEKIRYEVIIISVVTGVESNYHLGIVKIFSL